jgi:chromosomal replication initiation ATPase DnaA
MEGIWEAIKNVIKSQISHSTFQLWIEPLRVEAGPRGEMLLACPNPFALKWIQSHYLKLIQQALKTPVCRCG